MLRLKFSSSCLVMCRWLGLSSYLIVSCCLKAQYTPTWQDLHRNLNPNAVAHIVCNRL